MNPVVKALEGQKPVFCYDFYKAYWFFIDDVNFYIIKPVKYELKRLIDHVINIAAF